MIGREFLKRMAVLACSAGMLLITACGGVPFGLTEDAKPPLPTTEGATGASPDPLVSASPAPNMDLTPDTVVNSGMGEQKAPEAESVRLTLHFITDEGYVLPVSERIEKQDGIARACLMRLIASDDTANELRSQGLNAPIPAGTQIALTIEGGEARVNLSGMSALESGEREQALYTAIVNTLTQFPSVQVVTITLNGAEGETENGSIPPKKAGQYALNPENSAIETGADGELSALMLYFPNESGSLFVPITRYVGGKAGLVSAISQLAAGTALSGLRSCFPENTLILGAAIENGILSVNCSDDFMKIKETPELYTLAMQSVMLTAREFGSVDEIRFMVNGIAFEPEN